MPKMFRQPQDDHLPQRNALLLQLLQIMGSLENQLQPIPKAKREEMEVDGQPSYVADSAN